MTDEDTRQELPVLSCIDITTGMKSSLFPRRRRRVLDRRIATLRHGARQVARSTTDRPWRAAPISAVARVPALPPTPGCPCVRLQPTPLSPLGSIEGRGEDQGVRRPHHLAGQACHVGLKPPCPRLRRPDIKRNAIGSDIQQVRLRVCRGAGLQADATGHSQSRDQLALRHLALEVYSERRALHRHPGRRHPHQRHQETAEERALQDRVPQASERLSLAAPRTRRGRTALCPTRPPRRHFALATTTGQRGRMEDDHDYDPNENHATDADGGGQRRGRDA